MTRGPGDGTASSASREFPFESHLRFTSSDDALHPAPPDAPSDWTETTWWSFFVPERALMVWLYVQMRPVLGTISGGAFAYGPGGSAAWELPYYGYMYHHPFPPDLDLGDVSFKNGVSVKVLEPGMRYALGYRFRDHEDFIVDVEFNGITEPVPHLTGAPPFTGSSHYDQHGRVTGTMLLRGERLAVDCIAVRDRSWGRRPELLGRRGRLSYCVGAGSEQSAFLAFCVPSRADATPSNNHDDEVLTSGYLLRDGVLRRLERATRHNTRDPSTGAVTRIELDGTDSDGRRIVATGAAKSHMFKSMSSLTINGFMHWSVSDGSGPPEEQWGEDQDVWPMAAFADRRWASARE